ncbi:MAG: hypothetical protein LUE92_07715 [Clostridiales bacterium]|nr:hypothetical protein [Clostridiales bacterium]
MFKEIVQKVREGKRLSEEVSDWKSLFEEGDRKIGKLPFFDWESIEKTKKYSFTAYKVSTEEDLAAVQLMTYASDARTAYKFRLRHYPAWIVCKVNDQKGEIMTYSEYEVRYANCVG